MSTKSVSGIVYLDRVRARVRNSYMTTMTVLPFSFYLCRYSVPKNLRTTVWGFARERILALPLIRSTNVQIYEKVSNEVFNPLSCKTLVISRFFFVKVVSVSSFALLLPQFRQHVFVVFQAFLQELSIATSFS